MCISSCEVRTLLSYHMDGPSVLSEGASDPSRCRSIAGRSIGGRQVLATRALPAPHEACGPDQLRMPGRRPSRGAARASHSTLEEWAEVFD